jgi:hypothetical protein
VALNLTRYQGGYILLLWTMTKGCIVVEHNKHEGEKTPSSPITDSTELFAEDAMQFVEIETKAFSGTAVSIKDMPGSRVVGVFATEGPAQMFKTLKLFKLAQMDPRKIDEIEELTFRELGDALDQWMSKSMKGDNDNEEATDTDFN